MSNLRMSIPHNLPEEEALGRIKNLLTNLKEEQRDVVSNVQENWQGNSGNFSFSAKGFDLSGVINVTPSTVDIDADLPFAVSLFKGTIKRVIEEKAGQLLA
jgi:hypothetical protein